MVKVFHAWVSEYLQTVLYTPTYMRAFPTSCTIKKGKHLQPKLPTNTKIVCKQGLVKKFKKKFTLLREVIKSQSIVEQNSWWTDCCMTLTLGGICLPRSLRCGRKFYFERVWLLLWMTNIMSLRAMMYHSTPCKEKLHVVMPVPVIETCLPSKTSGGMNILINIFIISSYWLLLESCFT